MPIRSACRHLAWLGTCAEKRIGRSASNANEQKSADPDQSTEPRHVEPAQSDECDIFVQTRRWALYSTAIASGGSIHMRFILVCTIHLNIDWGASCTEQAFVCTLLLMPSSVPEFGVCVYSLLFVEFYFYVRARFCCSYRAFIAWRSIGKWSEFVFPFNLGYVWVCVCAINYCCLWHSFKIPSRTILSSMKQKPQKWLKMKFVGFKLAAIKINRKNQIPYNENPENGSPIFYFCWLQLEEILPRDYSAEIWMYIMYLCLKCFTRLETKEAEITTWSYVHFFVFAYAFAFNFFVVFCFSFSRFL